MAAGGGQRSPGRSLTRQESAVLAAIGRRLTNAEIAAEFTVSVRTVESHVAALRRKLSADSRAALVTAALASRTRPVRLPQNSFVGRGPDLARVEATLERRRWVTVVGPGGSGKTRLALEVAVRGTRQPVVVELAHVGGGEVVAAVAGAVGVRSVAGDLQMAAAACGLALSAHRHLLVLDNCDRVAGPIADLVARLLAEAPSLRVLATSRSPVGGSDETVCDLPPLAVTGDDRGGPTAVQLFLDRAGSVRAGPVDAPWSDHDRAVAERICRRLDGLPLAIEIAAARVRHLGLDELADRLDGGFAPLDRAGPAGRHRTLEDAFAWSWDLLDHDEREALRRLAAVPGPFDLALASAVLDGRDGDVLRLADRSLVSPVPDEPVTTGGTMARFRVLEPVRDFALRRTDAAVVRQVRRAHARHHAELAGALAARALGDDSAAAGAATARISSPAAAALTWAVGEHDPVALSLASSLAVLVRQYGAAVEVLDAIGRAARDPAVRASATTADLLEIGGALSYGDLDLVADLAELALDKAASSSDDAADDPKLLAAHHLAAAADAYRDRGRSALRHAAIAEALAERCGDRWQLGAVRRIRGLALMRPELDDQVAAVAALESAMHTFALAGAGTDMNNCRYMMAAIAPAAGIEPERASEWAEQCAEFARASGNRHELAHAELTLATLATGPLADRRLDEAVATFRAIGDLRCLTRCFLLLADRGPSADRVTHLQQALDVAAAAHDPAHQATAAEQLVQAHWAADDHAAATVAYGRLVAAVGPDRAALRCPPGLLAELGQDGAGAKPGARGGTMPAW